MRKYEFSEFFSSNFDMLVTILLFKIQEKAKRVAQMQQMEKRLERSAINLAPDAQRYAALVQVG